MHDLANWFTANRTVILLGGYIVFGCATSSLPPPTDKSSAFYQWFYKFCNALAANVTAIRGKAAFEPPPPAEPPKPTA